DRIRIFRDTGEPCGVVFQELLDQPRGELVAGRRRWRSEGRRVLDGGAAFNRGAHPVIIGDGPGEAESAPEEVTGGVVDLVEGRGCHREPGPIEEQIDRHTWE